MAKNRKERSGDSFINRELGGMVLTLTCAVLFFCMATGNAVFYPLGGSVQKFMLGVVGFFGCGKARKKVYIKSKSVEGKDKA